MADKQIIITIGREFGSGGHVIADRLSEHYGIGQYDEDLLRELAQELGVKSEDLEEYDEMPAQLFFKRKVRGMTSSMAENVAELEQNFLRDHAATGASFVAVGRCAEEALKEYNPITIFIYGGQDERIRRIMDWYNLGRKDAEIMMDRVDSRRRRSHDQQAKSKWGERETYDICISSDHLDVDGTAQALIAYIDARLNSR